MANNHKRTAESMSVRFSGKYLELLDEIKELSAKTEQSNNNVMRYLMAIGLEAYKRGAIAGFDGKVVLHDDEVELSGQQAQHLNQHDSATMSNHLIINDVASEHSNSNVVVLSKKISSNFLD